jgi:hypothetical protein
MLVGQEARKTTEGLVITKNHYDLSNVMVANKELKHEIQDGFTESREMRHIARIPDFMSDDPLVSAALQGDRTCMKLMFAKYPFLKVCEGGV